MNQSMIQIEDGTIYKDSLLMHYLVAEKYNLDYEQILRVGFFIKGREVWEDRKPD